MGEFKRILILMALILIVGLGLLLPLTKWAVPSRPQNVPHTAKYSNGGGREPSYWIDCGDIAGGRQIACTVFQPAGEVVVKGVFQQTAINSRQTISYDGSAIHWKHGLVLRPLQLQCITGGKPPLVPDCK